MIADGSIVVRRWIEALRRQSGRSIPLGGDTRVSITLENIRSLRIERHAVTEAVLTLGYWEPRPADSSRRYGTTVFLSGSTGAPCIYQGRCERDDFGRVTGGSTTTYAYDDADRLTSATAPDQTVTAYSYDANGSQTAAGADSFTFDSADRLIAASANGLTETYAYTGDGVRLASTVGADTVEFLTDRAFGLPQTAIERDGAGTVLRTYAYGLGRIGQVAPASGPQYLHVDGLVWVSTKGAERSPRKVQRRSRSAEHSSALPG